MDDIQHLLKRFKESLDRDVVVRETVAEVVRDSLGFNIRLSDITVKGDTLRIKTSAPKRSAIKLGEERLLREIAARTSLRIQKILY